MTGRASRILVVNADDFGLTPGVSRGILVAHRQGIVTSATVMANLTAEPALDAEAGAEERLGLGLHVNLTHGPPVSPVATVPSLLEQGERFGRDLGRLAVQARLDEVRREVEAQVEAFRRRFDRLPTHLDSHHHAHRLPVVLEAVVAVAASLGRPVRALDPELRTRIRARGVATPDQFLGGDDPMPYWTTDRLLDALAGLPLGVTELMCHPGYFDERLAASRFGRQREDELAALCAPAARTTVTGLDIRLAHYGALASLVGH